MEKSFKISRIIIGLGVVILFHILFMNEDKSWLVIAWIFGIINYGISCISPIITKKIIENGKKSKNKFMEILFYILLPIVILSLFILIQFCIILPISVTRETLIDALFWILIQIEVGICFFLPYVQALIVLVLNHFRKIK